MTVLDASAVLAWLKAEPGAEQVQAALDRGDAVISAVNLAEVLSRFQDAGHDPRAVAQDLEVSGLRTLAFGPAGAVDSAGLRGVTRAAGLSLGDRACLALGQALGRPVLTADRAWATLGLPGEVTVIR